MLLSISAFACNSQTKQAEDEQQEPVVTTSNPTEAPTPERIIKQYEEIEITQEDKDRGISDDITVSKIIYESDGLNIVGYLVKPAYFEGTLPVIIYNRGGNREYGKIKDTFAKVYFGYIAQKGFVVLASQYRGNDGGEGREEFGGSDVNDVLRLIDIVKETDYMDENRIYMIGASRGGMMTYICCRKSDDIQAAAIHAGVSNCIDQYNYRGNSMKSVYKSLIGYTPEENEQEYIDRSAVFWANEIDVPLYIVHGGKNDSRVLTSQSISMAKQLEKHSKVYELVIYEDEDHGLTGVKEEVLINTIEWFNSYQ